MKPLIDKALLTKKPTPFHVQGSYGRLLTLVLSLVNKVFLTGLVRYTLVAVEIYVEGEIFKGSYLIIDAELRCVPLSR